MCIACPFHVPDLWSDRARPLRHCATPPSPPFRRRGFASLSDAVYGKTWRGRGDAMAFFQKLKERLFKSSSKIEEGIDAIIEEAPADAAPAPAAAAPAPAEAARAGLVGRLLGQEKGRVLDDAMLESLEELLIPSDMGVETALKVTAAIAEGRFGRRVGAPRDPRAAGGGDRGDPRAGGAGRCRSTRSGRRWCSSSGSTARARRRRSASSPASSGRRARRW